MSEERLKILLCNALTLLTAENVAYLYCENEKEEIDLLKKDIGITDKELKEIGYIE